MSPNKRADNKDGQIFFVGKDAAEALGYEAPRNAIKRHVDDDDRWEQIKFDAQEDSADYEDDTY